ncbi:extracellular solute-binding protein [Bosea sp. (in: a-proteobacteria)]|uniref:ABC transporter substrate-binding protein n=1 Tax=Bosea sp. (in: a-proteobacteria) TaxID=1871050 RepID=UPI0026168C31|nr:extracellular solute-binding protein [Bosea sp. (in: a-proteobacteria)]MCO5090218.1 extracellular solute-binding protein [Bosea sp. (in: a-proteobacteria)]
MMKKSNTLMAAAALMTFPIWSASMANSQIKDEYGSPELIEAAKKEGQITFYSALVSETEEFLIGEFNKRFPFVKVNLIRLPGGQLLTRVKTEAAAGKLTADVVDTSDPVLVMEVEHLFADYAPPNADQYPAESHTKRLWSRTANSWCISYNTALITNPPKTWQDLADPKYAGKTGMTPIPIGGSPWILAMFHREKFGIEYWKALAANKPTFFTSTASLTSALIQGEIQIGANLSNVALPKAREGAPIDCKFPEGPIVVNLNVAGVFAGAKNPNAARLFMNWSLSKEGQTANVKGQYFFSTLAGAPFPLEGYEGREIWIAKPADQIRLRPTWSAEWNAIFNYH